MLLFFSLSLSFVPKYVLNNGNYRCCTIEKEGKKREKNIDDEIPELVPAERYVGVDPIALTIVWYFADVIKIPICVHLYLTDDVCAAHVSNLEGEEKKEVSVFVYDELDLHSG